MTGYNGARYEGLYHCTPVSLNTITAALAASFQGNLAGSGETSCKHKIQTHVGVKNECKLNVFFNVSERLQV